MSAPILEYLHVNGEKMESEIAKALQMPIALVQDHLRQLSASGQVICCKVTRYLGGKKVEGTSYRLSHTRSGKPMQPLTTPRTR